MIRMAQYGTKHGHAAGKLKAMLDNPEVEVVGLYETRRRVPPTSCRRRTLSAGSLLGQRRRAARGQLYCRRRLRGPQRRELEPDRAHRPSRQARVVR